MEGTPNLGPYSDVEAFIVGDGVTAINNLLGLGWRIIGTVQYVLDERGARGTEAYRKQYIPYAAMGRAIEGGEMADRVRADAIQYSEAQTQTAQLREDDLLSDVPALIDEPDGPQGFDSPPQETPAPPIRRRPAKSIADVAAASVRD